MTPQVRSRFTARRRALVASAAVLLTGLAACGDDGINNSTPQPPRGIVVLDGFIQPGYTFLGDTGSASTKLTLAPTSEFDAGGFTLLRDTVLTVSSWVPPTHPLQKAMEEWGADVEKASGGTIKFKIFPSQQLGKAFDHYDMAKDGIADVVYVNPGYQPGRFPVIAGAGVGGHLAGFRRVAEKGLWAAGCGLCRSDFHAGGDDERHRAESSKPQISGHLLTHPGKIGPAG